MHRTMAHRSERITLVQRARLVSDTGRRDECTGAPIRVLVLNAEDLADVSDRLGGHGCDEIIVELADRLQARLCQCGVTTHLANDGLGIECVGLLSDDAVGPEILRALATPLDLDGELVEVRADQ